MDGFHLTIQSTESPEMRIRRLISENPVVIFTRSSTSWMCHVMNRLLLTLAVHPTVIQLEDDEIVAVHDGTGEIAPVLFIGGTRVGGLESLLALHLRAQLVPKLMEIGAPVGV
ncbi:glutaredoxin-C10-like [Apium graveolens]|uniref:glutaredoxin-C10-like n=1 Tax=Apium graveolens TaxID=4045 RepID=UPI003D790C97